MQRFVLLISTFLILLTGCETGGEKTIEKAMEEGGIKRSGVLLSGYSKDGNKIFYIE